ncbi:MAG TPA: PQQ-binding-like beta-propeller repeat protein, partial [Ktedonobacterales bacterium]|nr:PQQ-binding-like beta-propeller repeat protein [Ktedonobacterales bacterium]
TGGQPEVPLLVDGALYFTASIWPLDPNAQVGYLAESLDAKTGNVRWRTPLTYLPTPLAVADGAVYVACAGAATLATPAEGLVALNMSDGAYRWRDLVGSFGNVGPSSAPAVEASAVYVYARDGLMAVGTQDGAPRWKASVPIQGESLQFPVQVSGRNIYALTLNYRGHLVVVASDTGTERWRYDEPNGSVVSVVLG